MDNNKITLSEITDQLLSLKDSGVVGIKQSFEDEGVILEDVSRIKRLCDKLDLKLNVKIGGCEAISDINNCLLFFEFNSTLTCLPNVGEPTLISTATSNTDPSITLTNLV